MRTGQKLLIAGGLGWLLYYWYKHQSGSSSLTQLATSTNPAGTITPGGSAGSNLAINQIAAALPPPVLLPQGANPDPQQLQALMVWADSTRNPPLIKAWLQQIDAADMSGLYSILVNQWQVGANPTPAETEFWNDLRSRYPLLNTGGAGCNNFQCN